MMGYHQWHEFPQDFRAGSLSGLPLNPAVWKKSMVGARGLLAPRTKLEAGGGSKSATELPSSFQCEFTILHH
ncbi:hypothetical protein PoB_004426800 [Plakobranchus ocellatus]|uniref:Uncharacterized protein n=1 Tax=Plakobranchus ocellatus TaxID=259542 RepID=A0AAV4BF19_9GAST|nr:hypothetical protein PoB_004426800 [Plakobranchus ocellatus]